VGKSHKKSHFPGASDVKRFLPCSSRWYCGPDIKQEAKKRRDGHVIEKTGEWGETIQHAVLDRKEGGENRCSKKKIRREQADKSHGPESGLGRGKKKMLSKRSWANCKNDHGGKNDKGARGHENMETKLRKKTGHQGKVTRKMKAKYIPERCCCKYRQTSTWEKGETALGEVQRERRARLYFPKVSEKRDPCIKNPVMEKGNKRH